MVRITTDEHNRTDSLFFPITGFPSPLEYTTSLGQESCQYSACQDLEGSVLAMFVPLVDAARPTSCFSGLSTLSVLRRIFLSCEGWNFFCKL